MAVLFICCSSAVAVPVLAQPSIPLEDSDSGRHDAAAVTETPAGTTILNDPQSAWYQYRTYIVAGGASIVILLFLVVMLLVNAMRRRAAERRLKRSERKYRSMFESLHDVYFEVTRSEGKILTVSSSVRKFGFQPDDLVGRNLATLNIPLRLRRMLANRIAHEGAVDNYELELHDANGNPLVASISAHLEPALDLETEFGEKIVGTIRDVSERRRMGEELKRLHKAIEEAGHAVYITDPHGVIQYVNPAFEQTTGYSRSEAMGCTPKLFNSGKMSDQYYARLWENINAGRTWREQIINRRKDGSLYHADQTIAPVLHDNGAIEWFVAIQTDNTERVESERQYRLLAENATDMIARHTPEGIFTYVSPACRDLLGYEPEQLVGVNSYTLFHPEDLENIRESHRYIAQGRVVSTVTYRMRRKNGTYTWLETTSKTIWDEETSSVSEIITVSRDVSQRVKMENSLKTAKSQAEAASQAKSEFVANVSHEIRTPLHTIMGYAELVRRRTDDDTSHRYIATIESSAKTLLRLLNDILDLSKVEAGRLEITPEFANIRELITSVVAMFEPQAQEQNVPLLPQVAEEVPELLYYDSVRLQQVLVNLIGNALKFTESGHVIVRVAGRYTEDERYDLDISVEDTGTGMSEETRKHVFEAFSQGETDTSRSHGGTGLGLAITQRLVERMGGTIEAQSGDGAGSMFRVSLNALAYRRAQSEGSEESARTDEAHRAQGAQEAHGAQQAHGAAGTNPGKQQQHGAEIEALAPRVRENLARAVEEQIMPDWKRTQEVKMLDEIVDFGERIETLGRRFAVDEIAQNGRRLADAAAESDVETMDRMLKQFRALAQQLDIDLD